MRDQENLKRVATNLIRSFAAGLAAVSLMSIQTARGADPSVQLITLDPGHFHAGLVQKLMYPQVSPVVHVYAHSGPDLQEHLRLVESFNHRPDNPTHWEEIVYTGPDFLERMVSEKKGNVVVIAGNNERKTEYIDDCVKAGLNVLADKPMAITPAGFKLLRKAFERADARKVLLYDIMTERHEMATILQRELAGMPELFGTLERGTLADPAVEMESVHHFYKEVAGKPLTRPAWFFDTRQQGEAVPDVGTHLVDLVQWECFPEQTLDWRKDIKVLEARRWATKLSLDEFKRATGQEAYPDFLKPDVDSAGALNVFQNGEASYTLRGVHAKVRVLWHFQAPPGTKDTHYSKMMGSRATLTIRQGPEQGYTPTLYIENRSGATPAEFEQTVRKAVAKLCATHSGVEVKPAGALWQVVVPDKYDVGHEAHFAQVTEDFLRFLGEGKLPSWEEPNMLAKYYTTTEAYRLSHQK
jgi:predicted dehydrogenase